MSSTKTSDPNGNPRQSTAASAPPGGFAWVDVYSVMLLGMILTYFAAMVYFASLLLSWSIGILRDQFSGGGFQLTLGSVGLLLLAGVMVVLLLRIVRGLIYDVVGLLTSANEDIPEASAGILLDPAEHPKMYELLAEVGRAVGSPAPDEIRVQAEPMCITVELRQFGISTQRRLVLVLGLPELCVLSTQELKTILGHELAHFGRGDTRLDVFTWRFDNSLQRSVQAMQGVWWRVIDPIYWFRRLFHHLFESLAAPVSRYREILADRISATAFGGDVAARTLAKDWIINYQFTILGSSFDGSTAAGANGQPDIFTTLEKRCGEFTRVGEDYLVGRLKDTESTSFWDPEPSISQRIDLMRQYPSQEDTDESRASTLVNDLDDLRRRFHEELFADSAQPGS